MVARLEMLPVICACDRVDSVASRRAASAMKRRTGSTSCTSVRLDGAAHGFGHLGGPLRRQVRPFGVHEIADGVRPRRQRLAGTEHEAATKRAIHGDDVLD